MADEDDEGDDGGPIVELGDGEPVDGTPLARVSSRQTWGIEKSRLRTREADTEIRTPDGPQRVGDVLDSIDAVYFARRQDFENAVENVIGTGPVPTADRERDAGTAEENTADGTEAETVNGNADENGAGGR